MEKTKEETQRVNLFLSPGLVQKAKHQALKEGLSLSQLVDSLFEKHLPSVMIIEEKGDKDRMEIKFVEDRPKKKKKMNFVDLTT